MASSAQFSSASLYCFGCARVNSTTGLVVVTLLNAKNQMSEAAGREDWNSLNTRAGYYMMQLAWVLKINLYMV